MKTLLAFITATLLVSCGNHGDIKAPIPKATPVIAPVIRDIRPSATKVEEGNKQMAVSVAVMKRELGEARKDYQAASDEIDRLAAAGSANKAELMNLSNLYKAVGSRNMFLENGMVDMSKLIQEQATNLTEMRGKLDAADTAAIVKDGETMALREGIVFANDQADKASERARKAELSAANAKVYKWWLIGIIVFVALAWAVRETLARVTRGGL